MTRKNLVIILEHFVLVRYSISDTCMKNMIQLYKIIYIEVKYKEGFRTLIRTFFRNIRLVSRIIEFLFSQNFQFKNLF